jgi:hypothetical protein
MNGYHHVSPCGDTSCNVQLSLVHFVFDTTPVTFHGVSNGYSGTMVLSVVSIMEAQICNNSLELTSIQQLIYLYGS